MKNFWENLFNKTDERSKNFLKDEEDLSMHDVSSYDFITPNYISNEKLSIKMIDGKIVYFGSVAYDEIIYSTDDCEYDCVYALVYKGKLVALGEEQGYYGGFTNFFLTIEENPRQFVEALRESLNEEDRKLYEKIKDMEIATLEELPACPKTIYHLSDSLQNDYYLNDNQDGTFSLWLNNPKIAIEGNPKQLAHSYQLSVIRETLFTHITNCILEKKHYQ